MKSSSPPTRSTRITFVLVVLCTVLILSAFLVKESVQHSHPAGARVRAVIVLTRHGDRSPIRGLPTSTSTWPEGAGQLTHVGMKQHYDLGRKFRERYVDAMKLLNKSYMGIHEVVVRSTAKERTLMSAQAFLLGLYPPGSTRGFPQHLIDPDWGYVGEMNQDSDPKQVAEQLENSKTDLSSWVGLPDGFQPIPIHSIGKDADHVLYAYKNCPKLKLMSKEFKKSQTWQDKELETASFRTTLASILNISSAPLKELNSISTLLHQEQRHNKPTPSGITPQILSELRSLQHWCLLHKYPDREFGRLAGGHLPLVLLQTFQDIIAIEKHTSDKQRARFTLLSAHDGTILATMAALGIVDFVPPEFAAFIVFELVEIAGEYSVYGSYVDVPFKLQECDDQYCKWDQFKLGLQNSYYEDWYERCHHGEGLELLEEETQSSKTSTKSRAIEVDEEGDEVEDTGNVLFKGFKHKPKVTIIKEQCPVPKSPLTPPAQAEIQQQPRDAWVTREEIEFMIGGIFIGAVFCFLMLKKRDVPRIVQIIEHEKKPVDWTPKMGNSPKLGKSPKPGNSPNIIHRSPNMNKAKKSPNVLKTPQNDSEAKSPNLLYLPKSSLAKGSKEALPTSPDDKRNKEKKEL